MWFPSLRRRSASRRPIRTGGAGRAKRPVRIEALEARYALAADLLADVAPGAGSSNPTSYVQLGGLTFFVANDNSNGVELWKTDGTESGTEMVMDIAPGAPSSSPEHLTVFDGKLYFTANDQVHGRELWVSDGTSAGTQLVLDIDVIASSSPDFLTVVGDELMFSAYDATNGNELWKSDGTALGTQLVQDLRPGSFGSTPEELTAVGTTLFFTANNTDSIGRELWKYTAANGVQLVRNIADLSFESGNPQELTAVGSKLFFTAVGPSDNYFGRELYVSDGTSNGTVMVQDINPGVADSTPLHLTDINGTLWFSATTAAAGRELWTSAGTSPSTAIKNDYTPGSGGSNPISMVYGTAGVFVHYDTYNYLVYFPDSGSVEYRGNNLYPGSPLVAGTDKVYFARANSGSNYELWQIDMVTRAVTLTSEINPSAGSDPSSITHVNGAIYFSANDGTNGNEPWILALQPVVTISGLPGGNTGPEGTAINVSANFTSPGAGGPYTYAWSVTKQGAGSPFATGTSSTFSFTPNDNTTYDLSLTVTDSATQQGVAQQAIVVTNAVPTATIVGAPTSVIIGTAVNLTSTVTDPGALDTFTYSWVVMRGATQVATGTSAALSFTPSVAGTYDVTFTATDDDTGSDSDLKSFQVITTAAHTYVLNLYQDLLGRSPDASGWQYWVGLLNAGTTRGQMANMLMASVEYRQLRVDAIYQDYLGRHADTSGLNYWTSYLGSTGTELDFKAQLLASGEYQSLHSTNTLYVQALYSDILGSTPDAGGLNFWVQTLGTYANGRTLVINGILHSAASYYRLINQDYQRLLNRPVDISGADYWYSLLSTRKTTFKAMVVQLADSTEYGAL